MSQPEPFDTVMVTEDAQGVALALGMAGDASPRGWVLFDAAAARMFARLLRESAARSEGETGITASSRQVRLEHRRRRERR